MPRKNSHRMTPEERESKIDEMREWFFQNYEDPQNDVPYDSEDGDYVWMGRGPHEAQDVLYDQFGHDDDVPEDLIEELSNELASECYEWASIDKGEDTYWDALDYSLNPMYMDIVLNTLTRIRVAANTLNETSDGTLLHALLFVHVISCLETYLYDALQDCLTDPACCRRFIENYEAFHKKDIHVSALYKTQEAITDLVKEVIHKVTFHNLKAVKSLYKATLGKDIPVCNSEIEEAVLKRHSIVHHNCRDRDNNEVVISYDDVIALVSKVESHILTLDNIIRESPAAIETVAIPEKEAPKLVSK